MGERFQVAWEKDFRWLKRTLDSSCALCKLCQKTFKIDASGISEVKLDASGAKHKERDNILVGNSSQSHFTASDGKTATLSKGSVILTNEEHVLKAEIIQALKIVDGNFSFASANGDGDRFRTMFPDSAIAKSYKQGETRVKYCLQYGIAPHLKDLIVKDLANSPFTFKFDETTTSQAKSNMMYICSSGQRMRTVLSFHTVDHCSLVIVLQKTWFRTSVNLVSG